MSLCGYKYRCIFLLQMLLMSRETIRLIRDGEPRMATTTFTQLLTSLVHTPFPSANKCVCVGVRMCMHVLKWCFSVCFSFFSFFLLCGCFLLFSFSFWFFISWGLLLFWCNLLTYVAILITVRSVWHHWCEKTWNKMEEERMEPRDFCSTEK